MEIKYQNKKIGYITDKIIKFNSGEEFDIGKIKKAEYKSCYYMSAIIFTGFMFTVLAVESYFAMGGAMFLGFICSFLPSYGTITLYNKEDGIIFSQSCNVFAESGYREFSIMINKIITNQD